MITQNSDTTENSPLMSDEAGKVVAVCRNAEPGLPKPIVDEIHLLEDWGVEGDYHAGKTVRHRYLAKKYPTMPNRRQVLLVDALILTELVQEGIPLASGMMGENITISGLPLMTLSTGTCLKIGEAILEITEVREPCKQLNGINPGLLKAVMHKEHGKKAPQAGIMTCILKSGWVRAGDSVIVLSSTSASSV